MCTALTYKTNDHYFGRNLDYEFGYGQKIIVVPKNFPIPFRHMNDQNEHYAMIGMGIVVDGFPHYFDAMNEHGLAIAGLNFVGNAVYHPYEESKKNLAQYEFMDYVLCTCKDIYEAKELLNDLNIDDESFSKQYPCASLHWMISDKNGSVVVESCKDGLHVYDDPVGVLTNNPPFDIQMFMLNNYMSLSNKQPTNTFSKDVDLQLYSRGMGGLGLPGDLSSTSRFVRCAFTKENSVRPTSEEESVSQFFHIIHSVEQQKGCCEVCEGKYEYTIYSSCMNTTKGIYYYTTYNTTSIQAVAMHHCNLDSSELEIFEMKDTIDINYHN